MRVLYVLEGKDEKGEFQPHIGYGNRLHLEAWMSMFLPNEFKQRASDWRIVEYVPRPDKPDRVLPN